MQEIRCTKCNKLLAKTENGAISLEQNTEMTAGPFPMGEIVPLRNVKIEIQCPHNYRNKEGKNIQCKTLNSIMIQ